MRALAIPSAKNRACLAMGMLSPGAECPGHVPASRYKIHPGEGMGGRHVDPSGAMCSSVPFACWEHSFLLFIGE